MKLSKVMGNCLLVCMLAHSTTAMGPKLVDAQDAASGAYEMLGTPLKRVVGVGGAPFDGPDGTPYISASVNGSPAQFVSVHALTLQVDKIIEIPGTSSAPSMTTGADGNVYIGTTGSAELFRYMPGSAELESLGKPVAGETYIYGLTNGPGGKLYGGTYPGGKMFEYDPATGVYRSYGTLVPGEKYIKATAYDAERGLFYVGTGTSNRLVEFDPATGAVSANWMPGSLSVEEYPNSINLIGGKLFIQLNKSSKLIVMDKLTKAIEYTRTGVSTDVIPSPDGTKAYFFTPGDAFVHAYEFATKQTTPVFRFGKYNGWKSARIIQTGTPQAPVYTLSSWAGYNAAVTYDFAAAKQQGQPIDVPGQPIEIRSIGVGPDGKVYSSGIQGGVGIYNPATSVMEPVTLGISQAEGITAIGDVLYFGIYPQARLAMFDTSRPTGTGNPAEIAKLPADSLQDRPFGMVGVQELGKLFMGTVPQYGQLGGAFIVYDLATKALQTYRNLVLDQSIITLAYKDGKVYGGTSIWGAYGAPAPTATEGKMFVWDAATGQKELEIVPVPGNEAVTSLIVGPDGNIWGFGEGVLFIFNTASRMVTETHEVLPIRYTGTVWTDAFMASGKDGNVYGTARGQFFRIDGKTKQALILDNTRQFSYLTADRNGNLYMRSGIEGKRHELWRYTNPDLALAYIMERIEAATADGSLGQPLYKQTSNDVRQAVHHWKAGRRDQSVHFLNKAVDALKQGGKWASEPVGCGLEAGLIDIVELIQGTPES
ncbi:FIMAH domain-containing protein [Paenibacillus sp. GCM10012303]|uniref:FIMAH domain-containing protein n=1 Tax=Paenibacillus sp. GCM10012303 TaxID=3317340 RepID=UPI00361FAE5F